MVLQNLLENNFISKEQFKKFKNRELNLKKKKIEIVNEANSYTEEVRRSVNENFGFEKLYSQGLSIKTPLNIKYQKVAINSLRNGIEKYDKRHGWRGPITNKIKNKNWKKKLENLKLDPTLNWKFAEIISVTNNEIKINILEDKENISEIIDFNKAKWTLKKMQQVFIL